MVVKESVQLDYARVVQKELDLQLADELLQKIGLHNLLLLDGLESEYEPSLLFPN